MAAVDGLDEDVADLADRPVAEDRLGHLRQHRRISRQIRRGVGDVGEIGDTGQQEPENAGHGDEHPTRVEALRLSEKVDRVGDRLDPGQRRTAVGERAQQHQDRRAHHQPVALMHRHRSGQLRGVVDRQSADYHADDTDHDHQADHDDEEVGRQRELASGFTQAAQVRVADEEHHADRDRQAVGTQHRDRRHHRNRPGRGLHRHGDHVVDQQCRGGDLRHPRPEILPRDDVGPARAGVSHHDLRVRRGHQHQDQQDDTGDGKQ